eukprot:1180272-Prorocentrum_minimum.AAC.2
MADGVCLKYTRRQVCDGAATDTLARGASANVWGVKFEELESTLPELESTLPELESTLPELETTLPELETTLPDLEGSERPRGTLHWDRAPSGHLHRGLHSAPRAQIGLDTDMWYLRTFGGRIEFPSGGVA